MPRRNIVEGQAVLIVIDIQENDFLEKGEADGKSQAIPAMPGYLDRVAKTRILVDVAHEVGVPIIFVKEIHRPDHIDFGRELDGSEDVHCIETDPATDYAKAMDPRPSDYFIAKRAIPASSAPIWRFCSRAWAPRR